MKGRTFCEIRELAPLVGKKEKYVVKDLQKMISSGWFREGGYMSDTEQEAFDKGITYCKEQGYEIISK